MSTEFKYLHMRIYEELRSQIQHGDFTPGQKLPIEYELMERYAASRGTVRRALNQLVAEDYVIRIPAKGTFVTYNKQQVNLSRMMGFTDMLINNNKTPSGRILQVSLLDEVDEQVREALEITPLHKVYLVCRLRYMDGVLISLENAYIPSLLCPNLDRYITSPNVSLYRLYESVYGLQLGKSSVTFCAMHPPAEVVQLLGVTATTPVLRTCNTGYLADGRPLYYTISFYEGSKYIYKTTLQR